MKRKIICIDEEKCNGCGECIPECPEGALQVIDGKARLVSDLFCDGLGACIGHCPQGAIGVEEREAEEYDEKKVMGNIVRQGPNVIRAHLEHLKEHNQDKYLEEAIGFLKEKGIEIPTGFDEESASAAARCEAPTHTCPGARIMDLAGDVETEMPAGKDLVGPAPSRLRQWPVQLNLVPPGAPFLDGADLLISADCVPYAYGGFHNDLLRGKIVLNGCPKFDDVEAYREKLTTFFRQHDIKSVTVAHMEVPCCRGIQVLVEQAIQASGKEIPLKEVVIGIKGDKKAEVIK